MVLGEIPVRGVVAEIPTDAQYNDFGIEMAALEELVEAQQLAHQALIHKGSASGTKVRHTAPERIYRVLVSIPRIDKQRRIASILAAYDALIENNRRRIKLLEETRRLLYREWFVHFRFPGYEHSKFINGVPEGWTRTPLSEIAAINQRSLPSKFDGDILYVDISSVEPGRITDKVPFA